MVYGDSQLYAFLEALEIGYEVYRHAPLHSVADSQSLRGDIAGLHVRNMFLRDKKHHYWLVTLGEATTLDLKRLRSLLGASGSLSFANGEALWEHLGVRAGAVTPFAVINDTEFAVDLLLDSRLFESDGLINVHPLRNDRTVGLGSADLLRFLRYHHKCPKFVDFSSMEFVE